MVVAADLVRRGYKVAFPYGEDWDFDLILFRSGQLERVQVKYTESNGTIICVRCRSHSLTGGRVRTTKHYTSALIDWLAIYDRTTDRCYYVPSEELGSGRSILHLRLRPTRNFQRRGIRFADEYLRPEADLPGSEPSSNYA
jgi:PD-(D/E)XK endonuclease